MSVRVTCPACTTSMTVNDNSAAAKSAARVVKRRSPCRPNRTAKRRPWTTAIRNPPSLTASCRIQTRSTLNPAEPQRRRAAATNAPRGRRERRRREAETPILLLVGGGLAALLLLVAATAGGEYLLYLRQGARRPAGAGQGGASAPSRARKRTGAEERTQKGTENKTQEEPEAKKEPR